MAVVQSDNPSFCALPDDILLLIAQKLATPCRPIFARSIMRIEELTADLTRQSPLVSLSMTCIRLRDLYVPIVFKLLSIIASETAVEYSLPTPRVAVNVHALHMKGSLTDQLDAFLSLCPNLREVYCTGDWSISFLTLPTLEGISIQHPRLIPRYVHDVAIQAPLRVFRLLVQSRWNSLGYAEQEVDDGERNLVISVLTQARSTLAEIVIPGESTPLPLLASAPWSSLRELALYGAHPEALAATPIGLLLNMMPNLRVLTLVIAPRRCDIPLLIWPPAAGISVDIPQYLERVTIAFAQADDLFFAHISPGLVELSLRDAPRFHRRVLPPHPHHGADWRAHYEHPRDVGFTAAPALLTPHGASRIFAAMPDCTALLRLELVLQAPADFEAHMYTAIARACPRLRFLELHRYRTAQPPNWHTDGLPIPVDALAASLSVLPTLRVLRLNLDIPFGCDAYGRRTPWDASLRLAQDNATRVASAIPTLEMISLLDTSRASLARWRSWFVVSRSASGGVELHEDAENSKLDWDR